MSANRQQLQYIANTIEHVTNQYCQFDFHLFISHLFARSNNCVQSELGSVFRLGVSI